MKRNCPTKDGFGDKVKRGLYIGSGFTRNRVLNDTTDRILGIKQCRVRNQFHELHVLVTGDMTIKPPKSQSR